MDYRTEAVGAGLVSELMESAVTKMLGAFGVRVTPERVEAFVDAAKDESLCERCVVRACRNIVRGAKRVPFVVVLVEETREAMGTAEHATHVSDRRQLQSGDLDTWWATEAPVLVRRAWPELNGDAAIAVAKEMQSYGYVLPDWDSIAADLGFVDDHGPTTEREFWLARLPHILPAEENRYV